MMRRYRQRVPFASLVVCTAWMFLQAPVFAAEYASLEDGAEEQDTAVPADRPVDVHHYATAQAGYRFVSPDATTAAAEPYSRLKSGVAGGFSAGTLGSVSVADFQGALNQLMDLSSNTITNELRSALRDVRNK